MRSKTCSILLLAILAAVAVVAIGSEGQTPPPPAGDWEISDDTVFADIQLDVHGGIMVHPGGSLTLTDVDLRMMDGNSPLIRVESGGKIVWDGGNLTHTTTFAPLFYLVSGCSLNGLTFGSLYGVSITETGVSVTNCTFGGTDSVGIRVGLPINTPLDAPVTIADNTFINMARSPIDVRVSTTINGTLDLVVMGNLIDGVSLTDAINVTVHAQAAHIVMDGNIVRNGAYGGIALQVTVDDLSLRMNANRVSSVSGDGIRLILDAQVLDFDGMTGTRVEDAGNIGLSIWSTRTPLDGFALVDLTNLGAGRTALQLVYAYRVSLIDSRIETDGTDFQVIHGTLDIFTTTFERGSAKVLYGDSWIKSWRWLDITCQWEGGIPIGCQRVDIKGPSDELLLTAVTGKDGHWGNLTYTDWEKTENVSRTILQLKPVLVNPHGDIDDGFLPTDVDQTVTVSFEDPTPPVLKVKSPSGDVRQNTTSLIINGGCSDPYSGVALVQFSLDPNPDWDSKVWTDATGTDQWRVDALYLSEGEYTLYVRAFDRCGLVTGRCTNVTVGTVVIDLSPPVVTVVSPDPGSQPMLVNTTTVTISGWISEEVSSISIQRTTVPLTGTTFELETTVSEGLNQLVITATDLAGNSARVTLSVLRDTTPPDITITAPAEGALLNVTSVLVAGLLDDSMPGDHVVVNGVIATLSGDAFQVLLKGLDEGPGSIDVTAVDLAGNTATLSVDVIIDSLPPALKLVSPNDGLLTRQATVLLEGTTEAGAHITVQGTTVDHSGTVFSHQASLAEGSNIIRVTSEDEAGNRNSTLVVVVRDSIPPALDVYGLVDGNNVEAEGYLAYINGRTEPGAFLFILVGNSSMQVLTFPDGGFMQPISVTDNETLVTLRAEDVAGNIAFQQVKVLMGEVVEPATEPPAAPVDPVVTATVVTTGVLVMVGVAMSFEFSKFALLLMVLPLYARIKKHEVLDNKTRLAIHGLVVENPGMHYNEIIREFDLTNGVAAYHLDVLEREGFIRSIRDGTLRRFYSSASKVPDGHKATPDQTREQILELVSTNPGINQKALVDELGIGRTLVGYHLKTLIDEGYIEAHKEGRFTIYSRTRKRWFRLN